jgi:6-hydroxycyclohex-1-ene-1-carbonyl-CoA dehydrogenase
LLVSDWPRISIPSAGSWLLTPKLSGTWGCLPKYYPKVLDLVQSGKVQIEPFLETKPMSQIAEVFEKQHHGEFDKRQVLEPDF